MLVTDDGIITVVTQSLLNAFSVVEVTPPGKVYVVMFKFVFCLQSYIIVYVKTRLGYASRNICVFVLVATKRKPQHVTR
jgi:hypothetical protein